MNHTHDDLVTAFAPLFTDSAGVTAPQLTAIASALASPDARPVLSACCRAVALRSLITSASQSNNAEAARRAAMTLLEMFEQPHEPPPAIDDTDAIAFTRHLLERADAASTDDPHTDTPRA